MNSKTSYSTGSIQILWERNRNSPAPTMSLFPSLMTRLMSVPLQELLDMDRFLSPIHKIQWTVLSDLQKDSGEVMYLGTSARWPPTALGSHICQERWSINQSSKIKPSPARENCQLKQSFSPQRGSLSWSSVKSTLQRTSKKSDCIEKVNKRLISNIYMQAIHH